MKNTELEISTNDILQSRLQVDFAKLVSTCKQFGIVELGVFGSVLRDDFRASGEEPSDVDLLVEFSPNQRMTWQLWLDLQSSFEVIFKRKVDIVRKQLLSNPYRRAEILDTNRVIYEQQ